MPSGWLTVELKILGFVGAGVILWLVRKMAPHPGIDGFPVKRRRFLVGFRTLNYMLLIGLIFMILNQPLPSDRLKQIVSLLTDDLLNLLLLSGYLLFFLRQSYRLEQFFYCLHIRFGTYLLQYGYFWLVILNILLFMRIDNYYLPLLLLSHTWINKLLIEILLVVIFLSFQLLILALRKLRMYNADPEIQAIVAEVSGKMGVKVRTVRIWRLEGVINAYTTGLFFKRILLTEAMINVASPVELRLIIGHEAAHIKLNHLRIRSLIAAFLLMAIFILTEKFPEWSWSVYLGGGFLGMLTFQVVARRQEYQADLTAARYLNGGAAMADALISLFGLTSVPTRFDKYLKLLFGHPDLEDRVKRLRTNNSSI